jgi:hypothetical protein
MLGYYPDRVLPSKTVILPVNTSIYLSLYNESCSKFLTKKNKLQCCHSTGGIWCTSETHRLYSRKIEHANLNETGSKHLFSVYIKVYQLFSVFFSMFVSVASG